MDMDDSFESTDMESEDSVEQDSHMDLEDELSRVEEVSSLIDNEFRRNRGTPGKSWSRCQHDSSSMMSARARD